MLLKCLPKEMFITKGDLKKKKSSETIFWQNISTEIFLQKSQLHISVILPPCFAIMFICTRCCSILASVHGFSFSLPKHHPKDGLIKSPEYKSDLF